MSRQTVDHLSYSQIQNYLLCGRHYKFGYIDGIEKPDNDNLLFGKAWHKMIDLVAGTPQPINEKFYEVLEGELSHENHELIARMAKSIPIQAHLQGLNIAQSELRFEFTVPNVEVPVIGFIDAILDNGTPVDFKTAARKWSQDKADSDLQATFYIAGMHKLGLVSIEDFPVKFEYHIFTKTKNPDVQVLETWRTAEDVLGLFGLVGVVWDAIRRDVFVPNPTSWKCSERYCEFWERCKGGMAL